MERTYVALLAATAPIRTIPKVPRGPGAGAPSKIQSHFLTSALSEANVADDGIRLCAVCTAHPRRFAARPPTPSASPGGSRTRPHPTWGLENCLHMQARIPRQRRASAREKVTVGGVRRSRLRGRGACDGAQRKNRSSRREDVVCNVLTPTLHTNCEITSHSKSAVRLGPKDTG